MQALRLVKNEDSPRGFAFALTAYLLWGFLPIYMKAVAHISPAEVIAHRILWSLPLAGLVLLVLGRTQDIGQALRSPRMLAMASLTAVLITINWGTYVWAIGAGHSLDAALGYFINPLFSIFLGAVLLPGKASSRPDCRDRLGGNCRRHPRLRQRTRSVGGAHAHDYLGVLRLLPQDASARPQPGVLPGSTAPERGRR